MPSVLQAAAVVAIAVGSVGLAAMAAWRIRCGGRPWTVPDAALALAVAFWAGGVATSAVLWARTGRIVPAPGADVPLLPLLAGSAAGSGLAVALALARARPAELGLTWPRPRWLAAGLVAVLPVLALDAGWVALLDALGVESVEQEVLSLLREAWGRPEAGLAVAWGVLVAPLFEELLFRGFVLPPLCRRVGDRGGIAVAALQFGAMHGTDPQAVVPLCVLGVVLGWLRVRSRSLLPPLLLHVANNAATVGWVAIEVVGG